MKNEENGKKIWETPEVFDLDVKETKSGIWTIDNEDGLYSPS
jgi:hypothetical protein